jgi:hypothetical protein
LKAGLDDGDSAGLPAMAAEHSNAAAHNSAHLNKTQ